MKEIDQLRNLMEAVSDIPPNANYGDVEVSIAAHRAQQNSAATHQLKVFMSKHDSKQMRHAGDAYTWQTNGVSLEEMTKLVNEWYGNMQDIHVRVPAEPSPMRKVGVNWSHV